MGSEQQFLLVRAPTHTHTHTNSNVVGFVPHPPTHNTPKPTHQITTPPPHTHTHTKHPPTHTPTTNNNSNVVGFVFPAYESFRAIEEGSDLGKIWCVRA
jgi:hypothetical protein